MVPSGSGPEVTVVRPEHGELFPAGVDLPLGYRGVPVTVRQSVYLGSGWKHEIVLDVPAADDAAGVIRGADQLDWLGGANTPAQLAWRPERVTELAA